jgi:hypothetical protein
LPESDRKGSPDRSGFSVPMKCQWHIGADGKPHMEWRTAGEL